MNPVQLVLKDRTPEEERNYYLQKKGEYIVNASEAHTRIKQHLKIMEELLAYSHNTTEQLDELYYLAVDSRQLIYEITAYVGYCRSVNIGEGEKKS